MKLPLTPYPADTVAVTIWGGAEGAITIVAASIPVLRALIRGDKGRSIAKFDTANENRLNTTSLETLSPTQSSPTLASSRRTDRGMDGYIYGT
jgi:hypothetical protein